MPKEMSAASKKESTKSTTTTKAAAKKGVTKKSTDGATKTKRQPSAYNIFMKDKVRELKAKDSSLSQKDAFKAATQSVSRFSS